VSAAERVHPLAHALKPGVFGAESSEPLRLSAPAREIVQVLARRGQAEALAAALGLPAPCGSSDTAFGTALWLQPGVWAIAAPPGPEAALASRLADVVGDRGTVADQSHGRCVIEIEGRAARTLLAKGCRIDLHPAAFPVGQVAVTEFAHLGAALHRAGEHRYALIVMATFAEELWHWLGQAAAEYGYTVG
jgi:heterotetrameric sarcosine oxidase gamma subunit